MTSRGRNPVPSQATQPTKAVISSPSIEQSWNDDLLALGNRRWLTNPMEPIAFHLAAWRSHFPLAKHNFPITLGECRLNAMNNIRNTTLQFDSNSNAIVSCPESQKHAN
jgi:hypothetical protein